jgi:hypothetical protein
MTLNNSQFSANSASTGGGAIFNGGSLAISILTISNNLSVGGYNGGGGGIYNTGVLSVSKSIFVTNIVIGMPGTGGLDITDGGAGYGGALYSSSGTVGITNSTFYHNTALGGNGPVGIGGNNGGYGCGGALYIYNGNCTLVNCTVANNLANDGSGGTGKAIGGGICNYYNNAVVSLINTIIAGNSAADSSPDLIGAFVSSGVNLIGNNQGATGLSIFDFQNVAANLGPLQNNGGPTLTCAPLPGSYAIGYGTSTGAPNTDQRGVPRPQNGGFDIGAVQVVTGSPIITGAAMVNSSGFILNTIFDSTSSYRIQASTNLTSWPDLITNSSGGAQQFIDTAATNLNFRFYRTAKP